MRRRDFMWSVLAVGASAALGTLPRQLEGPAAERLREARALRARFDREVANLGRLSPSARRRVEIAQLMIDGAVATVQAFAELPPGPTQLLGAQFVALSTKAQLDVLRAQPLRGAR